MQIRNLDGADISLSRKEKGVEALGRVTDPSSLPTLYPTQLTPTTLK